MTEVRTAEHEILAAANNNGWDCRFNHATGDVFFDREQDRLLVRFSRKGAISFAKYNKSGQSALWSQGSVEIKKDRRKALLDLLTRAR